MKKSLVVLLFVFFCSCSFSQYHDFTVIPKIETPYLASVSLRDTEGNVNCSGIIVRNEKGQKLRVFTACHCPDEGVPVLVTTQYDTKVRLMTVIKQDKVTDLALLESINNEKSDGPFVQLADKEPLIGSEVWAIGNPSGTERIVSSGNLSKYQVYHSVVHYRFTAPISFGSSGGGLFNKHGKLIGLVVLIFPLVRPISSCDTEGCLESKGIVGESILPGGFLAVSLPVVRKFLKVN
jgi:S1-C subfamily serine protease